MRIKVITVATHDGPGLKALRKSMDRLSIDYTVLGLGETWRGFGMKVILTRNYLRDLQDASGNRFYTHFIFVDGNDTLFLKPITHYKGGIIFSTEKNCWPDAEKAAYYHPGRFKDDDAYNKYMQDRARKSPWMFLNSGAYIAPISEYLAMVDQYPIDYADDDQRYFTNIYLTSDKIRLDTECRIFQSYAFCAPDDFTIRPNKVINNHTKTAPAVIHFNGKCIDPKIYAMINYTTLEEVKGIWKDDINVQKEIHETFVARTNAIEELNRHRTFVENNIFGFGERSFPWLWWLVVQELPKEFTFLEIGVFKGQTLSLVKLLADMQDKIAFRYGVTPLSTEGGMWESDYKRDIEFLHDEFQLTKDYVILKGLSEDPEIIAKAKTIELDVLYIDGGHEERHITNDLVNYAPLVKPGGYMVIDDCCNTFQMPFGYFTGIQAVSNVVDKMLPPRTPNDQWEFIFSCVHNRVYKRK